MAPSAAAHQGCNLSVRVPHRTVQPQLGEGEQGVGEGKGRGHGKQGKGAGREKGRQGGGEGEGARSPTKPQLSLGYQARPNAQIMPK